MNRLRKKLETIPLTIASKAIKYLGINLPKETKDHVNEHYKPLKREIKEDIRRWKDLPISWIGTNQHCENGHTTKSNLHVQCNPYQNSNDILQRNRKMNPEICMETQKTSNSQSNSEQNVQCWRYHNT
jgi:hypothetical protein